MVAPMSLSSIRGCSIHVGDWRSYGVRDEERVLVVEVAEICLPFRDAQHRNHVAKKPLCCEMIEKTLCRVIEDDVYLASDDDGNMSLSTPKHPCLRRRGPTPAVVCR